MLVKNEANSLSCSRISYISSYLTVDGRAAAERESLVLQSSGPYSNMHIGQKKSFRVVSGAAADAVVEGM